MLFRAKAIHNIVVNDIVRCDPLFTWIAVNGFGSYEQWLSISIPKQVRQLCKRYMDIVGFGLIVCKGSEYFNEFNLTRVEMNSDHKRNIAVQDTACKHNVAFGNEGIINSCIF